VEVVTGFMARPGLKDSERFDTYEYEGIPVNRFFHNATPMGDQSNIVEAEYNNLFFASWFRNYLNRSKPDFVHFFHVALLSASAIDVCHELGIPMVMTPTDFWLICPTYQLRLADNSMCRGPDADGVNCVKHAVANTQHPFVVRIFNRLPSRIVPALVHTMTNGGWSWFWFTPKIRALCQRADFLRQRMNMLDKVVVPTRLMEEMLVSNGLNPAKVVFSRFGIRPAVTEPRIQDVKGKFRVGFIGGLSEHKGAHLLISAVRSLPDDLSWELKIYGRSDTDPTYFNKLQQLSDGDGRIQYCGTFPNEIIGKIIAELDVLVVPSIWYENTPLVMYSAQAAGCPVIASNLGGMAEVVEHEKNGLLFEAGNVTGLASAIERLAGDRRLLRQLAANAVEPKSISGYVNELVAIYSNVLLEQQGKK